MADKSVSLSTVVEKFSKEAEQSLREAQKHMEAYYQIVAQATEEEIGELVESLPADSRAEMNHKAYDTAFAKIQSDGWKDTDQSSLLYFAVWTMLLLRVKLQAVI